MWWRRERKEGKWEEIYSTGELRETAGTTSVRKVCGKSGQVAANDEMTKREVTEGRSGGLSLRHAPTFLIIETMVAFVDDVEIEAVTQGPDHGTGYATFQLDHASQFYAEG